MTIILIIFTAAISIMAFNRNEMMLKFQFNPYQTYHRREWYRLISHGFLHADWNHLIMNMLVLYFFGPAVEDQFESLAQAGYMKAPKIFFMLLYLGGIIISSLTTLRKHKDNIWYNSVGASGAVSAVVFTYIFFSPWAKLYLFFLIGIPAIIFAVLYLAYSYYMSKRNTDLINHDAHFIGAVYGLVFPLIINIELFQIFLHQINPF